MRVFVIVISSLLLLNLSSCKTKQIVLQEKTLLKLDSLKNSAKKIYLFKNKKLVITENNGSLSYSMITDEKSNVLQFVYEKDMDKVAYDGGYREEVVFEIPNTISELHYRDTELQNTKMLFGRYCFCRGQTGLYTIRKGALTIFTLKKETHFKLQFKIEEVPQIVNEISY